MNDAIRPTMWQCPPMPGACATCGGDEEHQPQCDSGEHWRAHCLWYKFTIANQLKHAHERAGKVEEAALARIAQLQEQIDNQMEDQIERMERERT